MEILSIYDCWYFLHLRSILVAETDTGASRKATTILRHQYRDTTQKVHFVLANGKKVRSWEITAALEDVEEQEPPDGGYTLKTVRQDPPDF